MLHVFFFHCSTNILNVEKQSKKLELFSEKDIINDYYIASKFECYELAVAEVLVLLEQSQRMVKRPKFVRGNHFNPQCNKLVCSRESERHLFLALKAGYEQVRLLNLGVLRRIDDSRRKDETILMLRQVRFFPCTHNHATELPNSIARNMSCVLAANGERAESLAQDEDGARH